IIDETTTFALIQFGDRASVSTDLAISYVGRVAEGDTIEIVCCVKNAGRSLLFAEASLYKKERDGSDRKLVAFGKHTKFSLSKL
ncbi:hypothetical protein HK100_010361, partial [Physocladia obscura]